jgi:hypothetical protein
MVALDQPALLEVLEVLKVADVGDRVRTAADTIYRALIEAELTDAIGHPARAFRGTPNLRNGHRAPDTDHHGPGMWSSLPRHRRSARSVTARRSPPTSRALLG